MLPRDLVAGDVLPGLGRVLTVKHRKDWSRIEVDAAAGVLTFDVPSVLLLIVADRALKAQAVPRKAASSIENPRLPSQTPTPIPVQDPSRTNSVPSSSTGETTERQATSGRERLGIDE